MQVKKTLGVIILAALLAGLLPATGLAAPAAQANLLTNPGLEQPYDDGKQASGWGRWFEDTGKQPGTLDYVVPPVFSSEVNPALVYGGSTSQHIGNKYEPWHGGIKQNLTAPAGTPLRFCAVGRIFANNEDFEKAPSVASKNGHLKVGIFPNGDAEWNTGGIVWSAEANPHDTWQQICVEATSGDLGRVTVFTSASFRGDTAYHLDVWWDEASLVAVAPPATTAPTAAPAQPLPTAQPISCETRPDGSVVYVVQSGDTVGAIALACDSTIDEIRRLNNLTNDLISVGQTLIVKGPTAPPTATLAPTAEASPTPEASPTATDAQVCVEAFNDANVNRTKDAGEQLLGGVGFVLSDAAEPKGSYVTSGLEAEPYCFAGLQPGSYTIQARPPLGVVGTTETQWPIGLSSGMKFEVAFGGSRNADAPVQNVPAEVEPTVAPGNGASAAASGGSSDLGRLAMVGLGVIILLAAGFMASLVFIRARR
ncbi:MAG TPA: LysM peptidoglycan-binding domain-containing protein [Anaerolineae bacterium]|nr:LysM peptidoglycan-binding domain-containing protein [Anaerolineae bacterium]